MPLGTIAAAAAAKIGGWKGLGSILGASLGRGIAARTERWAAGDRAAYANTTGDSARQVFDHRFSGQQATQGQQFTAAQAERVNRYQVTRDLAYQNFQRVENYLDRAHRERMLKMELDHMSSDGDPANGQQPAPRYTGPGSPSWTWRSEQRANRIGRTYNENMEHRLRVLDRAGM